MPPKPPRRHRHPHRDWRSLLPNLAQMVPWPDSGGAPRTEIEVLDNVLGYILYLQRSISIARGGAGHPGDRDTVEWGPGAGDAQRQQLVPYEEEEEEEEEEEVQDGKDPWLCTLDSAGGVPLSPPPQRGGLLGLSPSLLASPPPPGSPSNVLRDLFADVYLSPQVGTVTPPRCHPQGTQLSPQALAAAPQVAGADGILVTPGVAMGTGGAQQGQRGSPRHPKKKCVNGFIMFCCLNRKAYMSAHPGLASTVVTRELAQLWRSLSPTERRPYRQRARQFSRQHDRVVRLVGDKDGDGDTDPPAPLQLLLAAHAGTLGGGPLSP